MQAQQAPVPPHVAQYANYRFYDIAANLTDHQFGGHHHGKQLHDDRHEVIERAKQVGCKDLLIAAGSLEDAH